MAPSTDPRIIGDTPEAWRRFRLGRTRDAFVQLFGAPFLLVRQGPGAAERAVSFETQVVDPAGARAPRRDPIGSSRILGVTKAPGNPYPDRISVGRASNCDIVLRTASVSKLHAHFRPVNAQSVDLIDAESQNGTKLNGAPIAAKVPARVSSGDTIIFGEVVVVQLVDAARLYDLL